jgi:hypothetical protein
VQLLLKVRRLALGAAVLAQLGCGEASDTVPPAEPVAEVPDAPDCPDGQIPLEDESCFQPGVPPEACGDGFLPDDAGGCVALLPDSPCPRGTMAAVGETSCAPVADCGSAPWGNIPTDSGTQHVDAAFTGASDGTADAPWRTIPEALSAAEPGAVVAIAEGSYDGQFNITKPVAIWGRCPELVRLSSDEGNSATVLVSTDEVELHQLGISGLGAAISVQDADSVVMNRLWLHDTGRRAMQLNRQSAPTSVTMTRSLVENCGDGPVNIGSELQLIDCMLRDGNPEVASGGRGATVTTTAGSERGRLRMEGCVIEKWWSACSAPASISRARTPKSST